MADIKKCSVCGDYKSQEDFNKKKESRDGCDYLCRLCASGRHKREYRRNAVRIKQKAANYYAANKDRRKQVTMEYYRRTQPLKPVTLCKCGCGAITNPGRKYLNGHFNKVREYDEAFRLKMSQIKSDPPHETRLKMSESAKRKTNYDECRLRLASFARGQVGPKHHNWLGGISNEEYGPGWTKKLKEVVLLRDGGICRNPGCLGKSKKINRHHIDYNKKNNVMDNLITLCTPCHAVTNTHREKWQAFYEGVIRGDFEYLEAANVR